MVLLTLFSVLQNYIQLKGLIEIKNLVHKFSYWSPSEHFLCTENTKNRHNKQIDRVLNLGAFLPGCTAIYVWEKRFHFHTFISKKKYKKLLDGKSNFALSDVFIFLYMYIIEQDNDVDSFVSLGKPIYYDLRPLSRPKFPCCIAPTLPSYFRLYVHLASL